MSAWLVNKAHIDALVQHAIVEGQIPMERADEVGLALWLENYRSLNARYGDPIPDDLEYTFEGIEAPLDPIKVHTLLRCYDYQTCEHDDWRNPANPMRQLVDSLTAALESRHPECEHLPGPWGIENLLEAV